jgi:hypothetical protein
VIILTKKAKFKSKLIAMTVLAITLIVAATTACHAKNNDTPVPPPHGDTVVEAPLARVPDLRGYTLEALTHEFSDLGFTPSILILQSDEPKDAVLLIRRMGQLVPVPSDIDVYISAGLIDWGAKDKPETTSEIEPLIQRQAFEKIEFGGLDWLVLDEKEDKVLLLSEFVLFDMPYNNQNVSTTWETSTLRTYLNNEFFNSFKPQERERIAETRVINGERLYKFPFGEIGRISSWPVPAGNDTYDRIFLLSYDEERGYFPDDSARMARMAEDHPKQGGSYSHWWWWLRSPGGCTFSATPVTDRGTDISVYPVTVNIGVRPALWLYLE